jgi:hypothetical protein
MILSLAMSASLSTTDLPHRYGHVSFVPQAEVLQLAIGLQQMPLPFSWHAQHIPPWVVIFQTGGRSMVGR